MKIGFVSRWGVRCGISTYSDQLVSALSGQGADVFCVAETVGSLVEVPLESNINFIRCWRGQDMSVDDTFVHLKIGRAMVAHFQHEFGILNQARPLLKLLTVLKNSGVSSVFTCHTVMPKPHIQTAWFFADLMRCVDAVVVHTEGAKNAIVEWGHDPGIVHVIPHGTKENCQAIDKKSAREALGLPADPDLVVAVSLGFITPGKLQRETIREVMSLVRDGILDPKKFLFLVAGEPGQNDRANIRYCNEIQRLVEESQASDYIRIVPRFIQVEELPTWYGAADFAITASHQTFFSTSGRSHQEMAFGVPSISSRERLLSDLDDSRSVKFDLGSDGEGGFRAALMRIMEDQALRAELSANCLKFAAETSWTNVARQHIELYSSLINGHRP